MLGKKVILDVRSMKTNIEVAIEANYFVPKKGTIVPIEDADKYPPNKVIILMTGAQGEEFAALMRIANKTHKYVRLKPTDTVLLSASVIPTNHKSVVNLKDNLYRSGAKIVTYLDSDIHASGHGNRDELKWIHQHIPYKFFMPVHGQHYMLCQHAELSYTLGHSKENVVIPDNGSIVEIYDNGDKIRILKEKVPAGLVLVDGFAVGNMQEMVIRDRKMLAQDGIFLIVVSLNTKTGKLKKSPDIISRGFVYLRESQDLLNHTRMIIKKTVEDTTKGMNPIDFDLIKGALVDDVGRYLFQQTAKKPIVIPVILGV
jgi:ribonuclease J